MPSKISCLSHEVGPFGAVSQKLVERILEPETPLQKWTIFIRETFQNSNDQRKAPEARIGFKVHVCEIPDVGRKFLKNTFEQEAPFQSDISLGAKNIGKVKHMLVVADTNTKGLSGERNPGLANEKDSNFNNFFFFVGQLKEKEHGGGIFGVGRNVLFSASRMRTIFAFSVFENADGEREEVFMGMSATDSFEHKRKLYTGRHWWGIVTPDNSLVSPYVGSVAREMAEKLGLSTFLGTETGTVFGILDPDIEDFDTEVRLMADSFLVHAWPHLLRDSSGGVTTEVDFRSPNIKHEVIDPLAAQSPVRNFAKAYLLKGGGLAVQERPHTFVGDVKTLGKYDVKGKVMGQSRWIQSPIREERDVDWLTALGMHPGNSIALLRASKLVIRYEYERLHQNTDEGEINGVFVVDPDYEKVFRDSENATHDNWSHGEITLPTKGAKNPVRQFWKQLEDLFTLKSDGSRAAVIGDEAQAAEISSMLGSLIPVGLPFGGKPKPPSDPSGGGGGGGAGTSSRRTIMFEDSKDPQIIERDSESCLGKFYFKPLHTAVVGRKYQLQVKTSIWLGDSFEQAAPAGAKKVLVEKIEMSDGGLTLSELPNLTSLTNAQINGDTEIIVTIRYPLLAQVACNLSAVLKDEVISENT